MACILVYQCECMYYLGMNFSMFMLVCMLCMCVLIWGYVGGSM
jgi:hypothetical protein